MCNSSFKSYWSNRLRGRNELPAEVYALVGRGVHRALLVVLLDEHAHVDAVARVELLQQGDGGRGQQVVVLACCLPKEEGRVERASGQRRRKSWGM